MDEIAAVATTVQGLEQQDAAFGGSALLPIVLNLHARVASWRASRGLSATIEQAIAQLQGDVGAWAGWLAFDAGAFATSERLLSYTMRHGRFREQPELEVRAMSYLVLLLNRTGRHREALDCAEASQRLARGWATPTVQALLAMRVALSQARLRERSACGEAVASAHRLFEHGPDHDDPLWAKYFNGHPIRSRPAPGRSCCR